METPVSDIQVESKDETRSAEVRAQDERQEEKASMLCFKRRKKSAKAVKPKAGSGAADEARECASGAGASDQPQPPAGAWASIKRLVTRRKRSGSSKQQKPSEAKVHPEVRTEDANLPKKKAKSRLRIPCIKFSKREKRHSHSESIEDADCSIQVQEEAEQLDTKTPTKSDDRAPQTEVTPEVSGEASQKGGEEVCEPNVSNSRTSPGENVISVEVGSEKGHSAIETGTLGENVISVEVGSEKGHFAIETGTLGENVISVELGLERGHSAIETGTLILEKDIETTEENQSIPPQQTSPLGTLETEHQLPVVSDAPRSPASPEQQIAEETRNGVLESVPNGKDHESGEAVAEEIKPKDHELSQESDFKENETSAEKPKPEENKRMEPIAIIITDTEISEFDVKKSKNVPKQFLMSTENEKGGGFAECGFEGKTSEQYETLLIETASSLVKNAIQLSIEQLVNEMASGDNKINNLLQ